MRTPLDDLQHRREVAVRRLLARDFTTRRLVEGWVEANHTCLGEARRNADFVGTYDGTQDVAEPEAYLLNPACDR